MRMACGRSRFRSSSSRAGSGRSRFNRRRARRVRRLPAHRAPALPTRPPKGARKDVMRVALIHNWWSLVLRGVLGIILGIVTFAWPGITLAGIVILFGAYALLDGIVSTMGAVRAARDHERWGVLGLEGIAGIGAASVAMAWPAITAS